MYLSITVVSLHHSRACMPGWSNRKNRIDLCTSLANVEGSSSVAQQSPYWYLQIINTSSGDGSIKILSEMGLHDKKQRREDPHGRSLLPYKMSKVRLQIAACRAHPAGS